MNRISGRRSAVLRADATSLWQFDVPASRRPAAPNGIVFSRLVVEADARARRKGR
jgi:hypothetical protein